MTPDERRALLVYADAMPAGTTIQVPREWLRELLAGDTQPLTARDLTVSELAARYSRHHSTVRLWLEQDRFPGAYKLRGRDWRVPPAAVTAFEQAEREGKPSAAPALGHAKPVNLGDWRRVS